MEPSSAFSFPNENNSPVTSVYDLGRELGSGAFSRVVAGTHKKTGTEYAIKIVDKEETSAKEMFKELAVMSQLSHPNIVNFKEIFDQNDGFYVVLELITGGELFDRIVELSKYSEKDASRVLAQALFGLKHMHERNLVHRDIKPENLLLSSKQPDANVKVADFGFSTNSRDDQDLYETLGTPPYMAPEIVILRNDYEDSVGYGRPVDVWALGICLYILLAGVHPYQQQDDEKMLEQIETGYWPGWKREETWSKISTEAKDLVRGMMNPDSTKRLTIMQCLEHPWLSGNCGGDDLGDIQSAIKSYQARKRMKGAILGVMATNKMKLSLSHKLSGLSVNTSATPVATVTPTIVKAEPIVPKVFTELVVTIIDGRGLAIKDSNGKSDPYLNIWCGATKNKTKVQKKTLDPVWNETFVIPYSACAKKNLEIECWDHDSVGKDEFMGEFSISIDNLPLGETKQWYKLEMSTNKGKKGKVSGDIQVSLTKK